MTVRPLSRQPECGVCGEVARMTARDAKEQATKHLTNDHPDEQPDL